MRVRADDAAAPVARPRAAAPPDGESMPATPPDHASFAPLDECTAMLVEVAAVVAAGDESAMRLALRAAASRAPAAEVEEVLLQSYLFAGFPRALNAMRLWRAASGTVGPVVDNDPVAAMDPTTAASVWQQRGEQTCATVYGSFYDPLRVNIAHLHPALDAWMVGEGYGKVLGRPGLDLARRELCVVAACVSAQQERQLHSHLHGALHAGASPGQVGAALELAIVASQAWLAADAPRRYRQLWTKVARKAAATGD